MTVNQNLEEDLIGLFLVVPDRYFETAERLRPEHFKVPFCRAAYAGITEVHREGASFSLSMVEDRIRQAPQGVTVSAYLSRLKVEAPSGVHVEELAEVLIARWNRERGEEAAKAIAKIPGDETLDAEDIPDRMITTVIDAFAEQRPEAIYSADELGREFMGELGEPMAGEDAPTGFMTGFAPFDDLMGPFAPGAVTVIAGATSMGKSALSQQIAWMMAREGVPVLFATNEMTAREAFDRCIAQASRVGGTRIKRRLWNSDEGDRLGEAAHLLRSLPLHFDGKEKPRVSQLKVRAQRMIAQRKIQALVIDHLQFVEGTKRGLKEFERLSEVTSDIKAMAKALGIHVFLVSHLNRDSQNMDVKTAADIRRPRLSDLHGSSTIEKDADNVIFVHRAAYYLQRNEPDANAKHRELWQTDLDRLSGRAELIKAKKRGGSGFGIREVRWAEDCTLFIDPDAHDDHHGGLL